MLYAVSTKTSNGSPFASSRLSMVLQNGYVAGSVFGPDWKHVQEWPEAGPSRLQGENEEMHDVEEDEYEEEEEEVCSGVSERLTVMLICLTDICHARLGTERGSHDPGNGNRLSAYRKFPA
jgi:hypothetical protein